MRIVHGRQRCRCPCADRGPTRKAPSPQPMIGKERTTWSVSIQIWVRVSVDISSVSESEANRWTGVSWQGRKTKPHKVATPTRYHGPSTPRAPARPERERARDEQGKTVAATKPIRERERAMASTMRPDSPPSTQGGSGERGRCLERRAPSAPESNGAHHHER